MTGSKRMVCACELSRAAVALKLRLIRRQVIVLFLLLLFSLSNWKQFEGGVAVSECYAYKL